MKKHFDTIVTFKGYLFHVDGYIQDGFLVVLKQVYLLETDIEISDSLTVNQHNELTDLILELCTAQ